MTQVQDRERVGSRSVKDRRTPLGWVPWLALALLLALAALAWLIISNVTDENDAAGVDIADDEVPAGAAAADTGGVDCPSPTAVADRLFSGIEEVVGCQVDARVTVGAVADDNTFTVTDGSRAVAVVDGSRGTVLEAGQRIRVVGRVATFEFAEVKDELRLEKSAEDYARFEGKTVVLASSTTPA